MQEGGHKAAGRLPTMSEADRPDWAAAEGKGLQGPFSTKRGCKPRHGGSFAADRAYQPPIARQLVGR